MAIIIDIAVVVIILACIALGYRKGLIGAAVNILGFFIALIIALVLYTPISNFIINNTPIATSLQESIKGTVTPFVIDTEEKDKNENKENTPKVMTDYINNFIEEEKAKAEQTELQIIDNVSKTVAINLVKIAVIIVLFVAAKIALLFVKALGKIISNLPIVGQFNKLGGAIYGIIQGLAIVYILLAIVSLFAPTMESTGLIELINSSTIGKMMYNNNIILKIVF